MSDPDNDNFLASAASAFHEQGKNADRTARKIREFGFNYNQPRPVGGAPSCDGSCDTEQECRCRPRHADSAARKQGCASVSYRDPAPHAAVPLVPNTPAVPLTLGGDALKARDHRLDWILTEIEYAVHHGWPLESLKRLESMASKARLCAAIQPLKGQP